MPLRPWFRYLKRLLDIADARFSVAKKNQANFPGSSERELEHELNVPRPANAKVRVEAAIVRRGRDVSSDVRRWLRKVRMVERIEEAGSEFQPISLSKPECSLNRNVPCVQSWSYQGIARAISKSSKRW